MYDETVTCMICGKVTTQINHAHLKTHGLTSQQYKEMFPNSKMRAVSKKTREAVKQNMIKRNKSEKARQKVSEMFKGKEKTEEHKKALKNAKALEDKKNRAKINGDNRRGKKHSKETIERIARNSANQKHPFGGKAGKRKDLGHNCRSTWEANFARILNHLNIEYEFENIIWLKKEDGSDLAYLPDFYLPKYNSYVEIKGRWYDDAREKYELFKKQYPHLKIHLIEQKLYSKYAKRFKHQIEEWE